MGYMCLVIATVRVDSGALRSSMVSTCDRNATAIVMTDGCRLVLVANVGVISRERMMTILVT